MDVYKMTPGQAQENGRIVFVEMENYMHTHDVYYAQPASFLIGLAIFILLSVFFFSRLDDKNSIAESTKKGRFHLLHEVYIYIFPRRSKMNAMK